jgi:hypothetical protein
LGFIAMSRRRPQGHDSAKAYADQTAQWDQLNQEIKRWTKILKEVDASVSALIAEHDAAKAAYAAAIEEMRKEHEDPTKAPG